MTNPKGAKQLKLKPKPDIAQLAATRHARNINAVHRESLTLGERMSDRLADLAGSWGFISLFMLVLLLWIVANTSQLLFRTFDPYPFILLNLVLSCVAALQAPVIMMSQNRQEKKDRIRAEHDYKINLKAEVLIEEILSRLDSLDATNQRLAQTQAEVLSRLPQPKR